MVDSLPLKERLTSGYAELVVGMGQMMARLEINVWARDLRRGVAWAMSKHAKAAACWRTASVNSWAFHGVR